MIVSPIENIKPEVLGIIFHNGSGEVQRQIVLEFSIGDTSQIPDISSNSEIRFDPVRVIHYRIKQFVYARRDKIGLAEFEGNIVCFIEFPNLLRLYGIGRLEDKPTLPVKKGGGRPLTYKFEKIQPALIEMQVGIGQRDMQPVDLYRTSIIEGAVPKVDNHARKIR